MPSLKSTSKSGDEITLFATERRALVRSTETLEWIELRTDDEVLRVACTQALSSIQHVLQAIPAPDKSKGKLPAGQA